MSWKFIVEGDKVYVEPPTAISCPVCRSRVSLRSVSQPSRIGGEDYVSVSYRCPSCGLVLSFLPKVSSEDVEVVRKGKNFEEKKTEARPAGTGQAAPQPQTQTAPQTTPAVAPQPGVQQGVQPGSYPGYPQYGPQSRAPQV